MGEMKPLVNILVCTLIKYDTRVLSSTTIVMLALLFLFNYNYGAVIGDLDLLIVHGHYYYNYIILGYKE